MSDPDLPPELPPAHKRPGAEPNRDAFAFTAANLGLCAPMLALVLALVMSSWRKQGPEYQRYIVYLDMAGGLAFLCGAVFAVVALAGIPRHGRAGLSAKGLLGLLLNGIFLAVFASNFFAGRQQAKQGQEEIVRMREATDQLVEERLANTNLMSDPDEELARMGRFRKQIEASSKRLTGDAKIATEAGARFAERLQSALENYYSLGTNFDGDTCLDFSMIKSKDQFQVRRQGILDFLRGNDEFRSVMKNYAQVYREELLQAGLAESKVERFLHGLTNGNQALYDTQVKIRDTDEMLGQTSLELLSLMETNWGKWVYDGKVPRFEDEEVLARYNAGVDKVSDISEQQLALMKQLREQQLARYQQRTSRPSK